MKNLKLSIMKKKYIQPNLTTVVLTSSYALLTVSSIKISNEEVTGGMVKDAGDWGDIWGSDDE